MTEQDIHATFLSAFAAAWNRNLDDFVSVIGSGSDELLTLQNQAHSNWTLLHTAAYKKFTGGVRLLLSRAGRSEKCLKQMLTARDEHGQTALHISAIAGNVPICSMILDQANSATWSRDLLQIRDEDNHCASDVAAGSSRSTLKQLLSSVPRENLLLPEPPRREPSQDVNPRHISSEAGHDCVNIGTPLSSPRSIPKGNSSMTPDSGIHLPSSTNMLTSNSNSHRGSANADSAFKQIIQLQTQVMTLVQQLGSSQHFQQAAMPPKSNTETTSPLKSTRYNSNSFNEVILDEAEARATILCDFLEDRVLYAQHFGRVLLSVATSDQNSNQDRKRVMVEASTEPDDELEKSVLFVHGEKHVAGVELHLLVQWRGTKGEEEWMPVGEVQHYAVVQAYLDRQQEILEAEMEDLDQASHSLGGHVSPLGETERSQLAQQLSALRAAADSRSSIDTPLLSRGYSGKRNPSSPYNGRQAGPHGGYLPMRRMVWSQPVSHPNKEIVPTSRGMLSSEFQATQIADLDEVLPQPPQRGMTPDQLLRWLEAKKSSEFLDIERNVTSVSPTDVDSEKIGSRKNSNVSPLISRSESTMGNQVSTNNLVIRKSSLSPTSPPTSRGRVGFTEPPVSSIVFVHTTNDVLPPIATQQLVGNETQKPQTPASVLQSEYEERLRRIEGKNAAVKKKDEALNLACPKIDLTTPNSFLKNLRDEMSNAQEELRQWEQAAAQIESQHRHVLMKSDSPSTQTFPTPRSQTSTEYPSISQSMAVRDTASNVIAKVETVFPILLPEKSRTDQGAPGFLPPLEKRTVPIYDHKYSVHHQRPFSRPTQTAPLD